MKYYLPKNAEDASALIITLLVVVLLSTIAVSFLSTARLEQTATRNYSLKTMAEQFAISATEQAMAKIKQGFTANSTGTTVITTQPGAIRQFVFQNGQITSNQTVNLFTDGGNATTNGTANLNYLNNPTLNATLSGNGADNEWTITGNASQRIDLPLEEITVNGTVVGRVAYYVDDDGTKINLNGSTGNRSTLNAADSRPLSLTVLSGIGAATENAITTLFDGGASNSTSDIRTWTHIFRPEQVYSLGFSINRTTYPSAFFTAAPPRDFHMKYTPWGARRLFINDTTEVPLSSAGVNKIIDATSDQHLKNIYGQTFADKYTPTGLKQIAANMLQYRSRDTMNPNKSMAFSGNLIGSDNLDSNGIPMEYLGYAPYTQINEIGMNARLAIEKVGTSIRVRIILQICVECPINEYLVSGLDPNAKARLLATLENVNFAVNYSSNGTTNNATLGGAWGAGGTIGPFTYFFTNPNATYTQNIGWEDPNDWRNNNTPPASWTIGTARRNRNASNPTLSLVSADANKYHIGTLGKTGRVGEISVGFTYPISSNITINNIGNVTANIKNLRLLADYSNNSSIRDWVVGGGKDIGDFVMTPSTTNLSGLSFPFTSNNSSIINPDWADPEPVPAPLKSYSRICPHLRSMASAGNYTSKPWISFDSNSTWSWTSFGNSTWGTPADPIGTQTGTVVAGYGLTGQWSSWNNSQTTWTRNNTISGDPYLNGCQSYIWLYFYQHAYSVTNSIFEWPYTYIPHAVGTRTLGINPNFAFLDSANGNNTFTSPADIGKVPTNYPWRRLRIQLQPKNEVSLNDGGGNLTSQTLIPDRALLDVISFGTNTTSSNLSLNFAPPININRKFITSSGNFTSNRTIGLSSLLNSFDAITANSSDTPIFKNPYDLSGTPGSSVAYAYKTNYALGADLLNSARTSGGVSSNFSWSELLAYNIENIKWSPVSYWGSTNNATNTIRKNKKYPADSIVLPSEVVEIRDIADIVTTSNSTSTYYTVTRFNSADSRFIKLNEIRLSPFFPGVSTCSNFFTIYAYAQALDSQGKIDSEALTATQVEVEITTPATSNGTSTTPARYKVKKLYTQTIPMDQ